MKRLIMVAGIAGVGKTTLGTKLALAIEATYLDKDTLTSPMVEALMSQLTGNKHDRHSEEYLQIRPLEYESLWNAAKENLEVQSVVVSAPYVREVTDVWKVSSMKTDVEKLDASLTVVWITTDERTLKQRILLRGKQRDIPKLVNWDEYSKELEAEPIIPHFHLFNSPEANPGVEAQFNDLVDKLT